MIAISRIARVIQSTLISNTLTKEKWEAHIAQCLQYRFHAAMIPPCWVKDTAIALKDSEVRVASFIDFPLGTMTSTGKAYEAGRLVQDGVDLQGTFILPMTMVRRWSWAHTWISFSLLGMFVFNWILTLIFIPDILSIYRDVPHRDLVILACFGIGWGIGAVLFGLGMERLGMALGYPIIMGLIASLGALIPLLLFFPHTLTTSKGLILLAGTFVVVVGIVVCSMAASRKTPSTGGAGSTSVLPSGIVIAVLAGLLSCLPNVGMAFGKSLMSAAELRGIAETSAGNTVWALLFTFGCIANVVYCAFLIFRDRTGNRYLNSEFPRNLGLSCLMAAMWIGSFYLYGAGAAKLGRWGAIVGWPLFISLSIVMGSIWGMWRGE